MDMLIDVPLSSDGSGPYHQVIGANRLEFERATARSAQTRDSEPGLAVAEARTSRWQ
jgi:hypothetical protein